MLAIYLTSCLAPGCELLYVWSLAASTLADLLCMVFDKLTVSHAKSFAGPLLPVYSVTLRVLTATSCVTQSQSVTLATCTSKADSAARSEMRHLLCCQLGSLGLVTVSL